MASKNSRLHPDITIYQSKLVKKKPPTESYSENKLSKIYGTNSSARILSTK